MTEPQVSVSFLQPAGNVHVQSYPPVNQTYSTAPSVYPPQANYPQQQTAYPPPQPATQEKYPLQSEAPPPPYQAAPPQVILVNTALQPAPGQVIVRAPQSEPSDYLVFAILVTVFCCLPCGLVAIIKAVNVRTHSASGNYAAAERSSKEAKTWAWAGCICGGIWDCLVIGYIFMMCVVGPLTWWASDDYDDYYYY